MRTSLRVASIASCIAAARSLAALRFYDVPTPGDLRIGDRVRVDNGVIYRF